LVELGGIVFIVVSLLLFLVAGLGGWNDPSEIMILSSAVLSANAIVYYARRDGIRKKALNELYKKYARQNPDKKQSISESAEDKLNTLMEFIQKNFAEALTRESLAEVIKMNPNYLSGLFNTYTGKSLSQYIAEIRINESLKMLRQSRRTIIDVAFSSGFYSLATFNRSFKQVMKMTPSEYKIQNT
jgi:transcriptional regulator GlxA family with amidase domain